MLNVNPVSKELIFGVSKAMCKINNDPVVIGSWSARERDTDKVLWVFRGRSSIHCPWGSGKSYRGSNDCAGLPKDG